MTSGTGRFEERTSKQMPLCMEENHQLKKQHKPQWGQSGVCECGTLHQRGSLTCALGHFHGHTFPCHSKSRVVKSLEKAIQPPQTNKTTVFYAQNMKMMPCRSIPLLWMLSFIRCLYFHVTPERIFTVKHTSGISRPLFIPHTGSPVRRG